jgi:hypothetical protein
MNPCSGCSDKKAKIEELELGIAYWKARALDAEVKVGV